ncbi:MAG TPA: metal-dependent hydrolase [Microscillaceae bacterium]|jgi:kynurenine formamidase|nr:metal-dependent hydrolase [Microscillaceae bacterium]
MAKYFQTTFQGKTYQVDFDQPIDLSIPLRAGIEQVNCYYAEPVVYETIRQGNFVGSVAEGGPCNYQRVHLTPHGNGTHTECYGHISADPQAIITQCLQQFMAFALLITLSPLPQGTDWVLTQAQLEAALGELEPEAVVIRTLPNGIEKQYRQYSGTNPPYLTAAAAEYLCRKRVQHLLIDLPSVDREQDEGRLSAHKNFWNWEVAIRQQATITELIYVAPEVLDGWYLLNLQIISLTTDASPSKPILYRLNAV